MKYFGDEETYRDTKKESKNAHVDSNNISVVPNNHIMMKLTGQLTV